MSLVPALASIHADPFTTNPAIFHSSCLALARLRRSRKASHAEGVGRTGEDEKEELDEFDREFRHHS